MALNSRGFVLQSLKVWKISQGQLAGKICTVIDIVTCLPVEVWFHTNPKASETNFEADLLNLLRLKPTIARPRFYQSQQ